MHSLINYILDNYKTYGIVKAIRVCPNWTTTVGAVDKILHKDSSEDDIPSLFPRRTTYGVISLIKMCRKISEKNYWHHRRLMRCGQHWFAMFSDDPPYFDKTTFFSFSSLRKQTCNALSLAIPFKMRFRLNLGFWFNKKFCDPST